MVRKMSGSGAGVPCLGGFRCSRNSLILLNVLYIAVGCSLIGLAAYGKASTFIVDFSLFGGTIACGVFLLIIAIVGLIATVLHHQVTLFFFSIACACLAITASQQAALFDVAWAESSDSLRITMQKDYDCCESSRERQNRSRDGGANIAPCNITNNFPMCCTNNTDWFGCTGVRGEMSGVGGGNKGVRGGHSDEMVGPCRTCWLAIERDIKYALHTAGAVGLFFSFTEIVGVWLAFRYRNQKDPNANPDDFL